MEQLTVPSLLLSSVSIYLDPTCALIHFTKTDDRSKKFIHLLSHPTVDLTLLSQLCWNGIPFQLRMMAWQMLFGYLPCHSARREVALAQKRKEYMDSVKATQTMDRGLWRQIHIDILRTNPTIPLYQCEAVQKVCHACVIGNCFL
jgi:hypothetical protein